MIVLDTHVLVWADTDDRRLGKKARALLDTAWSSGGVAVPSIAFWEVGLLQQRRRLTLPMSLQEWRASLLAAGLVELSLDGEVAIRSLELAGLHDDPADRFVVATSLVHKASLMTADERLLDWRHPLERYDATA